MSSELHLKVFTNRSELVQPDGRIEFFLEGPMSKEAKQRYKTIGETLAKDYLGDQIALCKENPSALHLDELSEEHANLLDAIVGSVTSEIGRGLIVLTILQLCVKSIEPNQSIRLHKGGPSMKDFSWQEGISMRRLDSKYVSPTLRRYGLLKLNKDGLMMTRTLAENYPYSKVYKAYTRGARNEWATLVEGVEARAINPLHSLHYLLSQLLNKAEEFKQLADETIAILGKHLGAGRLNNKEAVFDFLLRYIDESDYAARIMEIVMHSLMQARQESGALGTASLVPLSQMRSANKKQGNVGDIELMDGDQIVEAWDAKYGKSDLRDELEELNDKLANHPNVIRAGFVTSVKPERLEKLAARRIEIEEITGVSLEIFSLEDWANMEFEEAMEIGVAEEVLARRWITACAESLAQRRPEIAPIDEPCHQWLEALRESLHNL